MRRCNAEDKTRGRKDAIVRAHGGTQPADASYPVPFLLPREHSCIMYDPQAAVDSLSAKICKFSGVK
jgi:hypothetical protein